MQKYLKMNLREMERNKAKAHRDKVFYVSLSLGLTAFLMALHTLMALRFYKKRRAAEARNRGAQQKRATVVRNRGAQHRRATEARGRRARQRRAP